MKLFVRPEMLRNTFAHKIGIVTHHTPTETNQLGQSGTHTFVGDMMDIVYASKDVEEAQQQIETFIREGNAGVCKTKTLHWIPKQWFQSFWDDTIQCFAIDVVNIALLFPTEREVWKVLHQYLAGDLSEINLK